MLLEVTIGLLTGLLAIAAKWYFHKFKFSYWTKLGVPQDEVWFPLGTLGPATLGWSGRAELLGEQYIKFKGE